MDLVLLIYTVSLVGTIRDMTLIVSFVSSAALLFSLISVLDAYMNTQRQTEVLKIWAKRIGIVTVVSSSLAIVLPKENVMFAMLGAYVAQQITTNPTSNRLLEKTLQIVEGKLDSAVSELVNTQLPKKP